jgi:aminoglycoside phosphotransferase (APT) family kinase protein
VVTDRVPPAADVMPFREGEAIDAVALAAHLAGRLPGADGLPEVWQFGGGNANLTYLVRYPSGAEYVVRRPPHGPVAPTSHDMGREFRVLSVLHRAFPPAPRAHLYCEDAAVIGAPFFVMERRRGTVVRGVVPPEFGGGRDPVVNRRLSEVLIDTLADFHRVDPAAIGLETLGRPEGFLARQVSGWTERYERARTRDIPAATQVSRWLADRLPPSPPPTLLHNDWRLDNMMVASDDPGRVVAVFDWDMCTRGDPLADLGSLLSMWFESGEDAAPPAPMPSRLPGFMTRVEAVRRYGERSGRDVGRVPYYHVFGLFKMAVVVQQIFVRYQRGQTKDARFAAMDQAVGVLMDLARTQAERSG